MEYAEAKLGRVFVLRLFDGETLHAEVEKLAAREGVRAATVVAVGGADAGSCLVVGPEDGRAESIKPMTIRLEDVHELSGCGTIFTDETGAPVLHMHASCGRGWKSVTGCVRAGVKVWQVMEVVVHELAGCSACRRHDPATGFKLLRI